MNETLTNIKKVAWRLIFGFQVTENFEREQGYDFLYCILPVLKKVYGNDPDKLKERLKANNNFFNCNPLFTGPIIGLTCAMEENEAPEDTIQSLKVGLMGPLAGMGDSLMLVLYATVIFSIGAAFALKGSIAGPLFVIPMLAIPFFILRYYGVLYGYKKGIQEMASLQSTMNTVTETATKFGCIITGAMIALLISVATPLTIKAGEKPIPVQSLLDSIIPNLIPILFVAIVYYLLTKFKMKPNYVLGILFIAGVGLHCLGVL
jgi:mannose/fructose/N-acetylgalactosamine-specific phosphotransferase system component IID